MSPYDLTTSDPRNTDTKKNTEDKKPPITEQYKNSEEFQKHANLNQMLNTLKLIGADQTRQLDQL